MILIIVIIPITSYVAISLFVGVPEAPFAAVKEHTLNQYIYISFLNIFLALIIAYFMSRKITRPLQRNWERNRQLQQRLEEKEQIRVELIKKMINIQEDERKRIARELHDETSQSLTSLLLMLKTVQQTNDVKSIQKLAATSREVIYNTLEEVQKISYELRPMALDKLGIDEALQRYIGDIGQHLDINIRYDNKGCTFSRLGSVIETTVYRIVQEALTNAVRHARPKNIEITLQSDAKTVVVIVQDDGIGFDLEYVQRHGKEALGILGMMERASLVGGEIQIDTAPGKGTRILLKLPLDEAVVGDYCEPRAD